MKDEGIESIRQSIKQVIENENVEEKDNNDPCWDGYEQRGMKKDEDGNEVPNCVPVNNESRSQIESLKESVSKVYEAEDKEDDKEKKDNKDKEKKDDKDDDKEKKEPKKDDKEEKEEPEHNLEVTPRIHKGLEDAEDVEDVSYKDEDGDDCLYFTYNGVKYKAEIEDIEDSEESDE